MNRLTIIFLTSLSILHKLNAQDSLAITQVEVQAPIYSIRLYLSDGKNFRAKLMAMKDSSIYIYQKGHNPDPLHKKDWHEESQWQKYNYNLIAAIKVTNKKLRTLTVLSGLAVGITTGIIIANGHGPNGYGAAAEYALLIILGGGVGSTAGVIVASSIEKKHLINGDWKKLEELKTMLKY